MSRTKHAGEGGESKESRSRRVVRERGAVGRDDKETGRTRVAPHTPATGVRCQDNAPSTLAHMSSPPSGS